MRGNGHPPSLSRAAFNCLPASPLQTDTALTAATTAPSGARGYGHTPMAPIPMGQTGVGTRANNKKRKSAEQGEGPALADKDGPGKAGTAGTLVTVKKAAPNLKSDKEYDQARKGGTGGTGKVVTITMSQFDPITKEEPGEATTGLAEITAGGTEPLPPSATAPVTVVEGGLQDRPIRTYAAEREAKAKGKGGTDKTKGPEK
jgi:hypothetical protein